MKQIRKRLTYANVMSSIAVFMVLGGATAFAATKIGANEIKANSIKTGKIVKEAVTAGKIKNSAVTTGKLANAGVTADKIADNAVTTTKIADKAVTGAKLDLPTIGVVPTAANAEKLGGKSPASYESKALHVQNDSLVSIAGTATTTLVSLPLPAGTYAIFARGTINNNGAATAASGANSVNCDLTAGASTINVRNLFLGANTNPGESEDISAQIVSTLAAGGTAAFTCTTNAFTGNVITPELTAISVQP